MRYGQDYVGGIGLGRLRDDGNRGCVTDIGAGHETGHALTNLARLVVCVRFEVERMNDGEGFGREQEASGDCGNSPITELLAPALVAFRGHDMTFGSPELSTAQIAWQPQRTAVDEARNQ